VNEQTARRITNSRGGGACEVRRPGVCLGARDSLHHRVKRGRGGGWHPANLLGVCGSGTTGCHGWIEANPEEAARLGYDLPTGADPLLIPARLHTVNGRGLWLLDDTGGMRWAETGELEPPARWRCTIPTCPDAYRWQRPASDDGLDDMDKHYAREHAGRPMAELFGAPELNLPE
jgi:hypothetical protein